MSYGATGPPKGPRKILVVRLGAMGDVIHALPAVAALKRGFAGAELTWAIDPQWAPLLEGNPFLDEVIELPLDRWRQRPFSRGTWREFQRARFRLREAKFDLAVDFQGLLKSATVTYFSRAERVFGFDRSELREPLAASAYSNRVKTRSAHIVDKNLELADATGARADTVEAPARRRVFPLPAGKAEPVLPAGDFVLTTPLAGWRSKQWPREYFAELAARLHRATGLPLVVDCAPSHQAVARQILDQAPRGACVLHPSSLQGLIAATRRARAVVGVDSGPLHLAAALEVPGVAIYGPTDPARNGPSGSSMTVLRAVTTTSYKRETEIADSMKAITPRVVWQALEQRLAQQKAGPAEIVHPVP